MKVVSILTLFLSVVVFLGCGGKRTNEYAMMSYSLEPLSLVKQNISETKTQKQDTVASQPHEAIYTFAKSSKIDYNAYALVIGISNYKQNSSVEYADYSALFFKELLTTTLGVPQENVFMLLNQNATSGQIKSRLKLMEEIVEKGGKIYFYFAGHGVPGRDSNSYILPSDMSADAIHFEQNLRLDKIYENFAKSAADKVYVFVDSCFSGKDDNGALLYQGVAPVLKTKKIDLKTDKLSVMTAGSSEDFANDYKEKRQRLFSYFLINELAKGNKNLSEVYATVKRNVKRASLLKGIGYKQIPQFYANGTSTLK